MAFKHPLCGATLPALAGVWRRAERVPAEAWPWLAYYSLLAILRAPVTAAERALLAVRRPEVPTPLFILGHWRSGTTHLVNLLAATGRFAVPTPVDVGLPAERLLIGRPLEPLLARLVPEGRWIDAVGVDRLAPQEDEVALANLGAPSFFEPYYLPHGFRRRWHDAVFLDDAGTRRWLDRAARYYARLGLEHPGKPLLIKNPVYTARLAALAERFAEARFVHCVRDPFEIYGSSLRFHAKLGEALGLTRARPDELEATVLETYARMMRRFERDRAELAPERVVDVRYEALRDRPLATLEALYDALGLDRFAADLPAFERHLDHVAGYRAGSYALDDATRARIEQAWAPWLERWRAA
jgi:omega-hydroxy-beta-dihydromenaquinone-9 sulfotransferase